jgi:hypothetical protein
MVSQIGARNYALAHNSLEHSASGAGPGMLQQKQETVAIGPTNKDCEVAVPGRSPVPAAPWPGRQGRQAQAARSRWTNHMERCH